MEGLVMAGQLILALSILVSLHEFGHYITAKWFKMRVDKFYLFFDFLFPVPTLLNFSLFKKKVGDTEYGIGWFPLGGYVSIAGMIDETQDASKLAATPEPWEFRGKPAWQRLIVMLGGIIVNIILGVLIYVTMTYRNGHTYVSKDEINSRGGIVAMTLGKEIGFKTGDKVTKINGRDFDDFNDLFSPEIMIDDSPVVTVERAGKEVNIAIPSDMMNRMISREKEKFVGPMTTFVLGDLQEPLKPTFGKKIKAWFKGEKSPETIVYPAKKAGLQKDDKVIAINGQAIHFAHEFSEIVSNSKNKEISLVINRKGKNDTLSMKVSSDAKVGVMLVSTTEFKKKHIDYNFAESISVGSGKAFGAITDNLKAFGKIFRGEVDASNAISGPIGIAKFMGGVWDWDKFWLITGLLSMSLAFMNALPIPALDGGHAIFLIWEMITGKAPSIKVQEIAQQIGTVILLGLMVFAFGNDIFKL
jgi:regulator of sigma E protease